MFFFLKLLKKCNKGLTVYVNPNRLYCFYQAFLTCSNSYPEFLTVQTTLKKGDIKFIKLNYDCCYIFSLGKSTEQNHIQQGRNSWVFLPHRLRFYTSSSYETNTRNIMENKRWALGVLHKSLVAFALCCIKCQECGLQNLTVNVIHSSS